MAVKKNVFLLILVAMGAITTKLIADETVDIPWLQQNLVPNPGGEEVDKNGRPKSWIKQTGKNSGVSVTADSKVFLKGKKSLKIVVPKAGTFVRVFSPLIPIEVGATYLFSIAFRQEGFNTSGKRDDYSGISSNSWIQWLNGKKKSVGKSSILSRFPYGPSRWDLRDAFEAAPDSARFAQICISISNNSKKHAGKTIPATLWIDGVQLRKYLVPRTPEWARGKAVRVVEGGASSSRVHSYFVAEDKGFRGKGGTWSRIVNDDKAERGVALQAKSKVKKGIMVHSPYYPALPPGLYRIMARVKIPDSKNGNPVGYVDVNTKYAGMRQFLEFVPDPEKAGNYIDFQGDFILRDPGWWSLRLYTYGKVPWSIDSLKVFPLFEFEDRQLLAIYPGSEGELPDDLEPPPYKPVLGGPRKPMKGLAVIGFGYDRYRIPDVFHVLHRDAEIKAVWAKMARGVTTFDGFPENPKDLFEYSIIFLCNVNVRGMGLKYKNALREYVKRGGALIVLGGHQAYERGSLKGSLIEEAMPVNVASKVFGSFIKFPKGKLLQMNPKVEWLKSISTASKPHTFYLHKVKVKPHGKVFVKADNYPFMVGGDYGKGRVVCILGVPFGTADAEAGKTGFWKWDNWIELFREACWWALRNPLVLTEDNSEN